VADHSRSPQNPAVTTVRLNLRTLPWARVWVALFPVIFAGVYLFGIRPEGVTWFGALIPFVFAPALAWRSGSRRSAPPTVG
jgi:hypothetical protein